MYRLSYYERKDPNSAPGNANKVSILLKDGIRRSFSNVEGEYKVDNLTIQGTADTIVDNQSARSKVWFCVQTA